jgi:hypothetical protein
MRAHQSCVRDGWASVKSSSGYYSIHGLFEESDLNKKISLIVPIILVLALCMLAGPAAAALHGPYWLGVGTGFVYKNGELTHGPASIYVNQTHTVTIGLNTWVYPNIICIAFPAIHEGPGFWWKITQTQVLPNGNIMFYAVPLYISFYWVFGNWLLAGPGFINVVITPPFAGSGNMHAQQYVSVSGLGAYFNGWAETAYY